MMKLFATILAIVCFAAVATDQSAAQGCCTVGASSIGGFESGVQPYRTLSAALNYQYNSITEAFQGRNRLEDPLRRTADVAYFNVQLEYGLQPRLSLLGSIYYSDKSRELTVTSGTGNERFPETASFSGSGIGDLMLLAKYQLVSPSILSPFGLYVGGGASLPTGSFTKEQNGSQLSIDLQPGTGATAIIGWAHVTRSFPELGMSLFATGSYRYAGSNLDGYRIGDEILANLGAEYGFNQYFIGSLVLRARFAQKDYSEGSFLIGTGGTYYDLMPGIIYIDGPSSARIFGQLPVYRNVRGIQLTLTYLLGFEYRYVFDFRSVLDGIAPDS
jgi:hypothetical protein